MPQTPEDVLPLARVKRELTLSPDVHDDDVLLVEHRNAAISWCLVQTGHTLETLRSPEVLGAAAMLAVRQLYDGLPTIRPTNAIWTWLSPIRRMF